jgi:hypothetical protein
VSVVKNSALARESSEYGIYEMMLGIGAPCHAEEDVGIDQARSNGHLIVILKNPCTRDGTR